MKAFITLEGVAAPLPAENIDTDVIIPMAALLMTPRAALGPKAFLPLRYDEEGQENPEFVLNRPQFRAAPILVAGRNFGCGSSRELAVNAIEGFGIRAIVAPSFGDIFFGNCIKNGVLPIVLGAEDHARVMAAAVASDGFEPFAIDLPEQTLTLPEGDALGFDIDAGHKVRLLEGRDEIALTLDHEAEIARFQTEDRARRPWAWSLGPAS